MKFIIFVILGFGIFNASLAKGIMKFFDDLFDELLHNPDSLEEDFSTFFSVFYDYDDKQSDEYDYSDESDESSEENDKPVQLPIGPSWLQNMHLTRPQPSGDYNRPIPEQTGSQQVPNWEQQQQPEQLPPSLSQPVSPSSSQQEDGAPQVLPSFINSKPIPSLSPASATVAPADSNSTNNNSTDSLIISTADDAIDDTDGEGVLVGEKKVGEQN